MLCEESEKMQEDPVNSSSLGGLWVWWCRDVALRPALPQRMARRQVWKRYSTAFVVPNILGLGMPGFSKVKDINDFSGYGTCVEYAFCRGDK